jgi:hypothetical protein
MRKLVTALVLAGVALCLVVPSASANKLTVKRAQHVLQYRGAIFRATNGDIYQWGWHQRLSRHRIQQQIKWGANLACSAVFTVRLSHTTGHVSTRRISRVCYV